MITTDGYREKSSDTIIFMCIIEKVTAIGRVTAIGYRPAIGCNIYTKNNNNDNKFYPRGAQKGATYKVPCMEWDTVYIGETLWSLEERLKEHKRHVEKKNAKGSAIRELVIKSGHKLCGTVRGGHRLWAERGCKKSQKITSCGWTWMQAWPLAWFCSKPCNWTSHFTGHFTEVDNMQALFVTYWF